MDVDIHTGGLASVKADALAVPLLQGRAPLRELDELLDGRLTELREGGEIKGKSGELTVLHHLPGLNAGRLLLVGVGKTLDDEMIFRFAGHAARAARRRGLLHLALHLPGKDGARLALEGVVTAGYQTDAYKAKPEDKYIKKITLSGLAGEPEPLDAKARMGIAAGEGVNLARELVNTPSNLLGPVEFAARAQSEGEAQGIAVEVLDRDALEALGAGALLGVAQGSARPPRMVRLTWAPTSASAEPHLWLVGKGVTFDSGGISLKPGKGMQKMKYDMAGAATVLGAIIAIARLEVPLRVTALLGLVENMPSGSAQRPGDIVTALNDCTVEVNNTDAEGRMVLADALCYAVREGATHLVDAATLTGAVSVALGDINVGLMTNDDAMADRMTRAGRAAGERFWRLPMDADYLEAMRGDMADLKNVSGDRKAGTITAGKFLEQFVDGRPWAHIDIAGTAWDDKGKPWRSKGASGIAVRTLVRLAERWVDV